MAVVIAAPVGLVPWLLAEEHPDDRVRQLAALLAGCARAGCIDGTDSAPNALDLAAHLGAHLPGGALPPWMRTALTAARARYQAEVWPACPCCGGDFEPAMHGDLYCHPCRAFLRPDGTFHHRAGTELRHRHPWPWPREEQAA